MYAYGSRCVCVWGGSMNMCSICIYICAWKCVYGDIRIDEPVKNSENFRKKNIW